MTGDAFLLGLLGLLTIVASVLLWNVFATARAKIAASHDTDYRRLAERAVDAEERTAESLADLVRHVGAAPNTHPAGSPERPR